MAPAIDAVNGHGPSNEAHCISHSCNSKRHFTSYTLLTRQCTSILKVGMSNGWQSIQKKAGLLCYSNSFSLNSIILLKSFITKASSHLKFKCVYIAMCFLSDESLLT